MRVRYTGADDDRLKKAFVLLCHPIVRMDLQGRLARQVANYYIRSVFALVAALRLRDHSIWSSSDATLGTRGTPWTASSTRPE